MKYLALLACLLLVGCNSGGDNVSPVKAGNTPAGTGGDNTPVVVPNEGKWGSLKCQQKTTCENPVLNLEFEEIQGFLEIMFGFNDDVLNDADRARFDCGQRFFKHWMNRFPQYNGPTPEELSEIIKLGNYVLTKNDCLIHQDLSKKIMTYFINSKEYKNEN